MKKVIDSQRPLEQTGRMKEFTFGPTASEYKIVALREVPWTDLLPCDTAEQADKYWRENIVTGANYNSEVECFCVLFLNTRRKIKGHSLISTGISDAVFVHPREVFRLAIVSSASAIILMHNHPSGESNPSEADIKITRELKQAGQLLKIEVIDHVIVGNPGYTSLRAMGYLY